LQVDPQFLEHYPEDPGGVCTDTPETCSGRGYGTQGSNWRGQQSNVVGCGCETMCYCNRRIIKGMVSVVDSMLRNLTQASAFETHNARNNPLLNLI
jgi:hypothetical protein